MSRRWRNLLPRRGRYWPVAQAPAVVAPPRPPAFVEQSGPRPRFPQLARRGAFQRPPLPVVAADPPVLVPPILARRRLALPGRRLEQFFPLPNAAAPPPSQRVRRPRLALAVRRGSFLPVLPQQVAAGPGPLVVPQVRGANRRILPPSRRGLFARVPLVGVLAVQAPPAPQFRGHPARLVLPVRRGQFLAVVAAPVVVAPTPPPVGQIPRRRAAGVAPARRGEFLLVAPTVPGPRVLVRAARPARAVPPRRGRFLPVVATPPPPAGPAPLTPALRRRERARFLPQPRGRAWRVVPDQVIYVPPAQGSMRAAARRAPDMAAPRRAAPDMTGAARVGPTSRRSTP